MQEDLNLKEVSFLWNRRTRRKGWYSIAQGPEDPMGMSCEVNIWPIHSQLPSLLEREAGAGAEGTAELVNHQGKLRKHATGVFRADKR